MFVLGRGISVPVCLSTGEADGEFRVDIDSIPVIESLLAYGESVREAVVVIVGDYEPPVLLLRLYIPPEWDGLCDDIICYEVSLSEQEKKTIRL